MGKFIGALDQGTTSTRFIVFDHGGRIAGVDQEEHSQIFPSRVGWSTTQWKYGITRKK